MRRFRFVLSCCALLGTASTHVAAAECGPDALGVSRTLQIDPGLGIRVGGAHYRDSLPLKNREVVLTFDDGPLPGPTERVLEALERQCVKATFFLVGMMAQESPHLVRRIAAAGHTIAAHSQTHPYKMKRLPFEAARDDIDKGFESLQAILPHDGDVAPFFRFPGLSRTAEMDAYVSERNYAIFGADVMGDDWQHIGSQEILQRVLSRLDRRGRGIILLHDIKPHTAAIVPRLLAELKARGYKVVHIVPKSGVSVALHGAIDDRVVVSLAR